MMSQQSSVVPLVWAAPRGAEGAQTCFGLTCGSKRLTWQQTKSFGRERSLVSVNTLFWCNGKLENTLYLKFFDSPSHCGNPLPPPQANLFKLKYLKITAAKQKHRKKKTR